MNNQELRKLAAEKDVKLWQIADEIGIADTTFSKWMRKELSEDEEKKCMKQSMPYQPSRRQDNDQNENFRRSCRRASEN